MPSDKPEIRFIQRPDGYHDVAILIQKVRMRRSSKGTEWWLVDHNGRVQERVDCDGFIYRPHLIVKLYCKAHPGSIPEIRHRMLMHKLRARKGGLEYSL